MSVKQAIDALSPIDNFYTRNGLDKEDRQTCYEFVKDAFPGKDIEEPACQGYCSLTFFVGVDTIVQFRPRQYKLNLLITHAAREVYGRLAPRTTYVTTLLKSGLLVYSMNRLPGVSYKDYRTSNASLANGTAARAILCKDLAAFLAIGWYRKNYTSLPVGVVGSSLRSRLELLCKDLPMRFQPTAKRILQNIPQIETLPWVLTHGDIVPSNMIINPHTHHLIGLVDWAEAEPLPFGICFYGLEEILGEVSSNGFHYHPQATYLRKIFWTELTTRIPELKRDHLMKGVRLARDLGILLWHGIAWDDGAINRVVREGRDDDDDEIKRLDAFFDVEVESESESDVEVEVQDISVLSNSSKL
ncbi:hypothetical protein NHQ30_005520 [Ciborinia camelliae]|nr:hypothetical protein NHQ30_005520 [Ciborinia camelliae]